MLNRKRRPVRPQAVRGTLQLAEWRERTRAEREKALTDAFGPNSPPPSTEAHEIQLRWPELDLTLPGACALVFPPNQGNQHSRRLRGDWLYLSQGLAQAISPADVEVARRDGHCLSGMGGEFGILVAEPASWASELLFFLLKLAVRGDNLDAGRTLQLWFRQRPEGHLLACTSLRKHAPVGDMRAMLFWPYLLPETTFQTSTGKFGVLIGTTITADELALGRSHSAAKLMLLLCRAGVGQRTDPLRRSVLANPEWVAEWQKIVGLDDQVVARELGMDV